MSAFFPKLYRGGRRVNYVDVSKTAAPMSGTRPGFAGVNGNLGNQVLPQWGGRVPQPQQSGMVSKMPVDGGFGSGEDPMLSSIQRRRRLGGMMRGSGSGMLGDK